MATRTSPRVRLARGDAFPERGAAVDSDLVARMTAQTRRWVLESDVHHIAPVVDEVVTLCREAGFSSRHCRLNVPVAVTEALANAMLRGNCNEAHKQVTVAVEISAARLIVEVIDEGCGFDLTRIQQSPDDADWLEREDGRGIFLMRKLMDTVENVCLDGDAGHLLRLVLNNA